MGFLGYAALHAPEYMRTIQDYRAKSKAEDEREAYKQFIAKHKDKELTPAEQQEAISIAPELGFTGQGLALQQNRIGGQQDKMAKAKAKYIMESDARAHAAWTDKAEAKTNMPDEISTEDMPAAWSGLPDYSGARNAAQDVWNQQLEGGKQIFGDKFADDMKLPNVWKLDDPKNPGGGYLQRLGIYSGVISAFDDKAEKSVTEFTPLTEQEYKKWGLSKLAGGPVWAMNSETHKPEIIQGSEQPEKKKFIPLSDDQYAQWGIEKRDDGPSWGMNLETNKPEMIAGSEKPAKAKWIQETRPDGTTWERLDSEPPSAAKKIGNPGEKFMDVGGALIGIKQDDQGTTTWTAREKEGAPEKPNTDTVTLLSPDKQSIRTLAAVSPSFESELGDLTGKGWTKVTQAIQGEPGAFSPPTKAAIQKQIMDARAGIGRIEDIRKGFKKDYLTLGGKARATGAAWADYLGMPLPDSEKKFLKSYTEFSTGAIDNLNRYITERTGAALSEAEATRLREAMPDPKSDSPEQFESKLDVVIANLQRSQKRYEDLLTAGTLTPGQKLTDKIASQVPIIVVPHKDAEDLDKKYGLIESR